jgi:hypothetical protein
MRKKKFEEHVQWHRDNVPININFTTDIHVDNEDDLMIDFVNDVIEYRGNVVNNECQSGVMTTDGSGGCINNIRCVFDDAENCHIGEFMIHEVNGQASKHVIQESIMGSSLCSTSKDISTNDSLLFMLLLSLGSRMSREERNKLGTMISLIQRKVEEETLIGQGILSACHVQIPLPTKSYDMRKIFECGRQQFTNYMPLPPITSPIPGYASVPLIKTLQILFSRGRGWDNQILSQPTNHASLNESWRSILKGSMAIEMMTEITNNIPEDDREDTILQPILLWSDSADINKVKNNRSSIKVHNIYIAHKDGQAPHCVFPLAIGSGKSSHDTFRRRMFEELNEMHVGPTTCIDASSGNAFNVRFFLLAVVQDRPEHSEFTGTIAHNGKYGALPGYSFPRSICRGS